MVASSSTRQALRFRGKSYLALVLAPVSPLAEWLEELADLSGRSPGFFTTRSIVLDIAELSLAAGELKALISALERLGIRVMGIEGGKGLTMPPGMPPLLNGGRQTGDIELPGAPKQTPAPPPPPASLLVEAVRSGQSVIFPDGDVTIIGSVASGAEIVASGSIHVYGALRGRAIAGAYGNPSARIFCRKLEAEFLAIDALYLTAEVIDPAFSRQAVQIWSEHEAIKIDILR